MSVLACSGVATGKPPAYRIYRFRLAIVQGAAGPAPGRPFEVDLNAGEANGAYGRYFMGQSAGTEFWPNRR